MTEITQGLYSSIGIVPGPHRETVLACQYILSADFRGPIWQGHDPFRCSSPVIMAQVSLIFFCSRIVYLFIKPLNQSTLTAQITAGIIMGPSFLSRSPKFEERILSSGSKMVLSTFAELGFMFHLFLLGVQIDTTILKRVGKTAAVIGSTAFFLPCVIGILAMLTLTRMANLDEKDTKHLPLIVIINAVTSFAVITNLLADLNILNSDMGRLATQAAMVCELWSYGVSVVVSKVGKAIGTGEWWKMWSLFWVIVYVIAIAFLIRPLGVWVAKQGTARKPVKDTHIFCILVLVLVGGFLADALGQQAALGCFVLGLAVPDGPPLGETLVYRLEAISTGLLLPLKFAIVGSYVNLFTIHGKMAMVVAMLTLVVYVGKFLGTFGTALYFRVPIFDALPLALVMCSRGVVDIGLCNIWWEEGILDSQKYSVIVVLAVVISGMVRPLIKYLYDPSRRYIIYANSSILQSSLRDGTLRVLLCIHGADNVPTIINLLELSSHAKPNPINVLALNLIELKGRASAILIPNYHCGYGTPSSGLSQTKPIVNAFAYYARHSQGRIVLQHFTAVSPYSSMHDDICNLAVDKQVTIVIVPFHKQWAIDGSIGNIFPAIRSVNQNVLEKAPCSVGVLVDRTPIGGGWMLSGQSTFRIALLFLGGADDREALALASRMVEHPHVYLMVVWFRPWAPKQFNKEIEDVLDVELMNDYKANVIAKQRVMFREEIVEDAEGTMKVIHSLEKGFDLFIVGRDHDGDSVQISGLMDWGECPELGEVGDMLATSDYKFSVLVVRQPRRAGAALLDDSSNWPIGS
ncbi:hypothetical protein NMG60_11014436 [Bertholletia excelsa]